MGTIRFIVALMLLLSALSSCDKFSSADGGMKENAIIATSDAIEIDHHHSRNHNKDVSRTEKSYSSQNEEMYAFEKRKYIYSGNPMLDNLTRMVQEDAYCSKSMSNEHLYKYTNEFLRKGELCDLKCINCGNRAMSMELSRLALGLNGLSDINESELEKYIKKCRFPNLTKKVVYERYIPELEKKRREEKETLVDY